MTDQRTWHRTVLKLVMATSLCLSTGFAVAEGDDASQAIDASRLAPRIVGGQPATIAQVPATVALLRRARVEFDGDLFQAQFCGGTALSTRWILTAAHCVTDLDGIVDSPASIQVLTSSADLLNPVNQPVNVERVVTHPGFISVENGSDIALLLLATDAVVTPIPVDASPITEGDSAFIAGWGAVNSGDDGTNQTFPTSLRGTFVSMTPGSLCGARFPVYNGFTDATTFCAGVPEGGKDTCQGDSGGPLFRVDTTINQIAAVTGITSWGIGCGIAESPGIYTNVASYTDWMRSVTGLSLTQAATPPEPPVTNPEPPVTPDPPVVVEDDPAVVPVGSNDTPLNVSGGSSGGAIWLLLLPLCVQLCSRLYRAGRTTTTRQRTPHYSVHRGLPR